MRNIKIGQPMGRNGSGNAGIMAIEDPPAARFLFGDTRVAWLWLIVRVLAGWEWLRAGWGKVNSPAWTGHQAGTALTGFVNGALTKTTGANPAVQGWYASFLRDVVLPHTVLWSFIVEWGELLTGIALIIGAFTGIAAFAGAFMNLNYLLAGTVSINPILLVAEIFLVLAWKTAGWWGLDRWLLPALGTPWRPGYIFHGTQVQSTKPSTGPA